MNDIYADNQLQAPQDTSPVLRSAGCAQAHDADDLTSAPKLNPHGRGEYTRDGARTSVVKYTVFVLAASGQPLTPTTSSRARKLLKVGVAKKVWSKFGTFGIQLCIQTRQATPQTALGVNGGTKFEGYAVVCGKENILAIKLDLPDKKHIVRKLIKRRQRRRARRFRKCRRRPARFHNRRRKSFLAPSQAVVVGSRLKVLDELFRCYPLTVIGFEDVRFNHASKKWGANFSTVEIGKAKLKAFFVAKGAFVFDVRGFETQALRKYFGYSKTKDKAANIFTSHCSDALALACGVGSGVRVEPGPFLIVDDTYRAVRRQLHDSEPPKGGIRAPYSRGTVFGLRKGLLVGTIRGRVGQLCGEDRGSYRYYDHDKKRKTAKRLAWVSSNFVIRQGGSASLVV
jgi:hypothetical protein